MKRFNYLVIFLLAMLMTLSSCELVGDILEVGVWLGVLIAAAVVGLIIWIISKFRR
ncbi:MAG: phosphatidate cytidylyltransferase [Bacteroidota bacterium]|nr:phosphatidate cytidylyltransferase [Bacteroidota bacterium]